MQGKGPTIPVRLNKRVLLRPMAMMAGDNLVDIRKATRDNRAEFRNSIKVYNGSVAAVMNKELGIQYRELAFRVSTFRRKQHTMYKTMCQLVALKRKMLKDAIAKEEHDARNLDIVARHVAANNAARADGGVGVRPLPPLESIASALAEISRANRPSPAPPPPPLPPAPQELASRTRLLEPLPTTLASPSNLLSSGDGATSVEADIATREDRRGLHWSLEPVADRVHPKSTTRSALVAASTSITERALKLLADSSAGAAGRLSSEPVVRGTVSQPPSCSVRGYEPSPADATQVVTSANAKKAFFTATISRFPALPPIGEAPGCGSAEEEWGDFAPPENDSAQPAPMPKTVPLVAKCWRLAARSLPSEATGTGDLTGASKVQWPASQTSRSQDVTHRSSPDRPSAAVSQSADSGSATSSGRTTLAAEVRRARKLKDAKRKEVLDSEICPVYRQTATGYFRAEETPYRREEFHVPTGSAEYRRRKLLVTVKSTTDEHAARAKAFLASISLQEEKENKIPVIQAPEILPPVTKFKSVPVTDSSRDLEKCTYVRQYIRPSERDANLPVVTSWHQKE